MRLPEMSIVHMHLNHFNKALVAIPTDKENSLSLSLSLRWRNVDDCCLTMVEPSCINECVVCAQCTCACQLIALTKLYTALSRCSCVNISFHGWEGGVLLSVAVRDAYCI